MFRMMKLCSFLITWLLFRNAEGSPTLHYFHLTVTRGTNSFTEDLSQNETTPIYVNKNDALTLTCSVSGQSFHSVLLFEKIELQKKTAKNNQIENVTIHYVKPSMDCSDAGRYKCRAGHLEWSRTIIVRCPPPVFTFKNPAVNIKKFWNLNISCELGLSSAVSIQTMDRKHLKLCYTSPCNYTFDHITCEAMGTYYCGSRQGDVIVLDCPPQLMKSDQTLRVQLGDSVNVSVDVLFALNHQLTIHYKTENISKCETKLCIETSNTTNKWRKQIKILIKNITTQDMGNQTFTICSNYRAESFCTNMTITILPLNERATSRVAKSTFGDSASPDYLVPVTLACAFFVTTVVLATVFFKLKGKHLLKAQLKERSQSLNRPGEDYVPETGTTFNAYVPNMTDTMNHHSTITDNGQTMTTEGLTFMTVGNTQVIKKTERTIIEEVRETVEIVNLDYNGTDQEHPVHEESNLQDHTYSNINFIPS